MRPAGWREGTRLILGLIWFAGQIYIIYYPTIPLIQRPLHLLLAMALVILWKPLDLKLFQRELGPYVDLGLLAGVAAATVYYMLSAARLTERMEGVDDIFLRDILFGVVIVLSIMECVRRVVGWSLLGVILAFLFYAFAGRLFPGWLHFGGHNLAEMVEILSMTANGILGVTTETSIQFVFYFVAFGAFYSYIGGSQLFIDIGLAMAGRQKGGAAKAAVVASSMMGSISGSAVANVAATGVFTIPLMRRSGLHPDRAGAVEAVASTGGQLMPPIMGISAFVMAELLQIDYLRIALAGIIPALGFYLAIFLGVDLFSRRTGIGTIPSDDTRKHEPLLPRTYLLLPPLILVAFLVAGYSATFAAVTGIAACGAVMLAGGVFRCLRELKPGQQFIKELKGLLDTICDATKQAASVAVPIAAIGIIISVSIQSNLALKFSSNLIEMSGGVLLGAMIFIIIGCIVMGMGLPTVAAYIIGAILFVPALKELGINELSAHFFVMYYCVLSMITPPVALASYTAAGMANANTMKTSLLAFRMSMVSFFIPFAFAFNPALLGEGTVSGVVIGCLSLLAGTGAWTICLSGYLGQQLTLLERGAYGIAALVVIFSPIGQVLWILGSLIVCGLIVWNLLIKGRKLNHMHETG